MKFHFIVKLITLSYLKKVFLFHYLYLTFQICSYGILKNLSILFFVTFVNIHFVI